MGRSSLISQSHLAAHASAPRPNPPQVTGVRTSVRLVPISLSLSLPGVFADFSQFSRSPSSSSSSPPAAPRLSASITQPGHNNFSQAANRFSPRRHHVGFSDISKSLLKRENSARACCDPRTLARFPDASPTPIHDTSRAPPAWLLVKRRLTFTSSSPT